LPKGIELAVQAPGLVAGRVDLVDLLVLILCEREAGLDGAETRHDPLPAEVDVGLPNREFVAPPERVRVTHETSELSLRLRSPRVQSPRPNR
jgi:hypothetical protein